MRLLAILAAALMSCWAALVLGLFLAGWFAPLLPTPPAALALAGALGLAVRMSWKLAA